MTRYHYLLALMLLSPPAYAGESFSFTVAGHRIHIEAPRHCNSTSCVSVSIPGIYESRRTRDRADDVAAVPAPVPAPAVAAAAPKPAVQAAAPVSVPQVAPVAAAPPAPAKPVSCAPKEVPVLRPQAAAPAIVPPVAAPVAPPAAAIVPPAAPPVAPPPVVTRPAPQGPPKILKVIDEEADTTPLGDWQTEGKKGSVRIEACGRALCGYVINPRSDASGESVLINMKPKDDSAWSGNIYSHDSNNTYYATMAMQGTNSLRVEACVFGRFFCTGNTWSRIRPTPERLITSRQIVTAPHS